MTIDTILQTVVKELQVCSFIRGIVLGGSRATGNATETSDLDIGIYYDGMDDQQLNTIASRLDDTHRESLICREGGWGNWVNCGGWLVIGGIHVDLILRDYKRVKDILSTSDNGNFSSHYQPGHPHAFLDIMYRGELASCRILSSDKEFLRIKQKAEQYPDALKHSLIRFFSFEAEFSCMLAEKCLKNQDLYYLSGHLFRSVSALNQILFAFNEQWCLNEKKAVFRIDTFPLAPAGYSSKVNGIFRLASVSPALAVQELRQLYTDVTVLCKTEFTTC